MARADSAHAFARAGAMQGLARRAAQTGVARLAQRQIWVRRAVPAMVALFAGALVAITVVMTREAYDRTLTDAFTDIELTAAVVTGNLNGTLRDSLNTDPTAALAQAVPSRAVARGQQLAVTDAAGNIVAAAPALSGQDGTLTEYLGPSQPLTIFAEKAGVLRITLADGADALAAVRTLDPPFGQLAIVHPVAAVFAEWQAAAFRASILSSSTVLVLIALAIAYFWQASRAREADHLCKRMQSRVDTALGRGRCGLWDWDLARGRILLVGFDVRDARHDAGRPIHVLWRRQCAGSSARRRPRDDGRDVDQLASRFRSITLSGCRL